MERDTENSGMTDGMPAITYEALYKDVPMPARATREAAGYDVCAYWQGAP